MKAGVNEPRRDEGTKEEGRRKKLSNFWEIEVWDQEYYRKQ
jgi:hypothetical protein